MSNPETTSAPSWKTRVFKGRFGRTILLAAAAIAVVCWAVVGTLLLTVELTTAQRMIAITIAALATEAVFWIAAAVFGVSLFQVIKRKFGGKQ